MVHITNQNSGFIIGITCPSFCKNPYRTHTPKTCLKKHPPTKSNHLVILCNEYSSTRKYQVKRQKYVWAIVRKLKFVIFSSYYFHNIIYTHLQPYFPLSLKNESFHMSVTHLKMWTWNSLYIKNCLGTTSPSSIYQKKLKNMEFTHVYPCAYLCIPMFTHVYP